VAPQLGNALNVARFLDSIASEDRGYQPPTDKRR
jgi:hypothetical protein